MAVTTDQFVFPRLSGDPVRSRATVLLAVSAIAGIAIAISAQHRWPVVVLLLIAPVIEEAIFRGGVQEWLLSQHWREWPANLAASVLFVGAHCLSRGLDLASLAVMVPALVFGWMYSRYRCLRLCIAMHMLMNMLWIGFNGWTLTLSQSL
jgi:membrane protease YdiL (CAAX protease family)